jgi:hypothetical protein
VVNSFPSIDEDAQNYVKQVPLEEEDKAKFLEQMLTQQEFIVGFDTYYSATKEDSTQYGALREWIMSLEFEDSNPDSQKKSEQSSVEEVETIQTKAPPKPVEESRPVVKGAEKQPQKVVSNDVEDYVPEVAVQTAPKLITTQKKEEKIAPEEILRDDRKAAVISKMPQKEIEEDEPWEDDFGRDSDVELKSEQILAGKNVKEKVPTVVNTKNQKPQEMGPKLPSEVKIEKPNIREIVDAKPTVPVPKTDTPDSFQSRKEQGKPREESFGGKAEGQKEEPAKSKNWGDLGDDWGSEDDKPIPQSKPLTGQSSKPSLPAQPIQASHTDKTIDDLFDKIEGKGRGVDSIGASSVDPLTHKPKLIKEHAQEAPKMELEDMLKDFPQTKQEKAEEIMKDNSNPDFRYVSIAGEGPLSRPPQRKLAS